MYFSNFWRVLFVVIYCNPNNQASYDVNILQQKRISLSIDHTVGPCDNFYQFACGNYAEQHPSNNYQEMVGLMDYQYNKRILDLLEAQYHNKNPVPEQCHQAFVKKTHDYLQACLRGGKRNIRRYFEEITPGPQLNWPILEEVATRKSHQFPDAHLFELWSLLGKIQSYGLNNLLINQEILVDEEAELSVMIEPAFTEKNTTLPDLITLEVLIRSLGVIKPQRIIDDLVKTNKLLRDILENYAERDEEDLEITYDDLRSQYPRLNLDWFLRELIGSDLSADTFILIRNPSYFQHLNDNMWQVFKIKSLCNYLMLKFLFYLAVDSTSAFKPLACTKDVRKKMDLSVNFLYHQHIYSSKAEGVDASIEEISKSVATMFERKLISNRLNLTDLQVQHLRDKLSNIRLNIGNLPPKVTCEMIDNFYANVPALDENNYYKNHLLLLQHRFRKSLNYAQNQTFFILSDNNMDSMSSPIYLNKQNMIVLPFASIEQPFYDVRFNDLYKYSLLGFILAHEYTHAFDTTGLNFDGIGQMLQSDAETVNNLNFQSSMKCLQSQLPTESIDERIADIVGMDIAYKMYLSKHHSPQSHSADNSMNKFFFLNLAQFFCGKSKARFIDHDTDAERLNQIAINSEGFAMSFRCPANSPMNPIKKCRLY